MLNNKKVNKNYLNPIRKTVKLKINPRLEVERPGRKTDDTSTRLSNNNNNSVGAQETIFFSS